MNEAGAGSSRSCNYNVTGVAEGTHNYTVYVNDSAGRVNSNGTFSITVDRTQPNSLSFVSPTLGNASTSTVSYVFVNMSFSETHPDSCVLEFNNATAANYTMTLNGSYCYRNLTVSNEGNFNYTVFMNDSAGNGNVSARRFVTINLDSTPPSVTMVSPENAVTLSSTPAFTFFYNDAVSSTASCVLYLDANAVGLNSSVVNNTDTSLQSNVTVTASPHSWTVNCTDARGNTGASAVYSFTLSTGGSGGAPEAPAPSPQPTAAPVAAASVAPSPAASVETTPSAEPVAPSAVPSPSPIAEVQEEEVVVEIEEPAEAETSAAGEAVLAELPTVSIRQAVYAVPQPSSTEGLSGTPGSVYEMTVKNTGKSELKELKITQRLRFMDYAGPSPDDYPGVVWNPRPILIEEGSAVVTWMFDNVKPGQEVKAEVKVDKKLEQSDIEGMSAPKVIARAAGRPENAEVEVAVKVKQEPTSLSFDYTIPVIAFVFLLVAAGVYVFVLRKQQQY
ncbi:hypothetical protein HZC09_02420 [Candidatus Micrarchaeota archaeon]|nr:hypothetical protein [Candidatus Micrarchaeota archaeon]